MSVFGSVEDAGGDPSDVQREVGLHIWDNSWIRDDLSVGDVTLSSFPIGISEMDMGDSSNTQSNIGLGVNSTFISALKDAGEISSRSYSWLEGLSGATKNAQMHGSNVFGSYDRAKTSGAGYTKELAAPSPDCWSGTSVTLSNVVLPFLNATEGTILGPSTVSACVQFGSTTMLTFAVEPYWNNFEKLTDTERLGVGGGNGLTFSSAIYDDDDV